ncbi:hypothetical protein BAL199_24594 [alpha proteobacterium BAL199]|nr:hypothetical protein BAL199_24594 [alpha proteobacterium BAL199]
MKSESKLADDLDLNDQIRGVAMAVRHWFDIRDLETLQRSVGILPTPGKKAPIDKHLRVLSVTALPPQIVRLKSDAPMVTLHYMQDVYDDGTLRADPWRWWFAWVSVELIARLGPDRDGSMTRRFVVEDPSIESVRRHAPRWLAANPLRLQLIERRLAELVDRASDPDSSPGRTIEERLRGYLGGHLSRTLVDAMAAEAASIAASITLRLDERARRG